MPGERRTSTTLWRTKLERAGRGFAAFYGDRLDDLEADYLPSEMQTLGESRSTRPRVAPACASKAWRERKQVPRHRDIRLIDREKGGVCSQTKTDVETSDASGDFGIRTVRARAREHEILSNEINEERVRGASGWATAGWPQQRTGYQVRGRGGGVRGGNSSPEGAGGGDAIPSDPRCGPIGLPLSPKILGDEGRQGSRDARPALRARAQLASDLAGSALCCNPPSCGQKGDLAALLWSVVSVFCTEKETEKKKRPGGLMISYRGRAYESCCANVRTFLLLRTDHTKPRAYMCSTVRGFHTNRRALINRQPQPLFKSAFRLRNPQSIRYVGITYTAVVDV